MKRRAILSVLCICFFLLIGAEGMEVNARNDTRAKTNTYAKNNTNAGNDTNAGNNAQSEKKTEAGKAEQISPSGKQIVLQSGNIKEYVYELLGKEPEEPLYEGELAGYEGKLYMYSPVIMSGDDLDFVRRYFYMQVQWDITFPAGTYESAGTEAIMEGWSREQLNGLGDLAGEINIRASEETIPVSVLSYFTKAESLIFDMRDVTGEMPKNWHFPKRVKSVSLDSFTSAGYRNLMYCMKGSQVEELSVRTDENSTSSRIFWLDHVAGMKELQSLDLGDNVVRVRDKSCLKGMKLSYLQCPIDGSTDMTILEELPSLETVSLAVVGEMDLTSLLSMENPDIRLLFGREIVEFEDDIYGRDEPVIIPSFDKALGWKNDIGETIKGEEEENFLAIYQRCMDAGRKIECFTIRRKYEEEKDTYEMVNTVTFFRVSDGEKEQIIMTERDRTPDSPFGAYRRDYFRIQDINFDGTKDIVLDTGSQGTGAVRYELGWIWDKESGEYKECESYRGIENPYADEKQKLVRSSWRNGAVSHGFAIYRYEDGEFVMKSEMEESLLYDDEIPADLEVPEGAEVWQWVETIYGDDGEKETRSFMAVKLSGENLEAPEEFYEPGSYWG